MLNIQHDRVPDRIKRKLAIKKTCLIHDIKSDDDDDDDNDAVACNIKFCSNRPTNGIPIGYRLSGKIY